MQPGETRNETVELDPLVTCRTALATEVDRRTREPHVLPCVCNVDVPAVSPAESRLQSPPEARADRVIDVGDARAPASAAVRCCRVCGYTTARTASPQPTQPSLLPPPPPPQPLVRVLGKAE